MELSDRGQKSANTNTIILGENDGRSSYSRYDADQNFNDRQAMDRLGKVQQFKRNFRFFATLGFASIFTSTWEFVLVASGSGFTNSGFGGAIFSFLWVFVGYSTVVVSLAEMASMAPTAGGQYHWVAEFAPKSYQKLLSYIAGWTSTLAWQPALAGGLYPVGVMIQTMVNYHNPDFIFTNWQVSLLMIGLGFLTVPFNTIWRRALPTFESLTLILHFAGWLAIIITLWVMAPAQNRNSAHEVWTSVVNSGGWSSTGLSLLVGQISLFYCMAGTDSAVHLAEEIHDSSVTLPRAMVWGFVLNGVLGFIMLVTMCFVMGPLNDVLNTAEPFVNAFLRGTGGSTNAATGLTIILLVLLVAGNNTCTATESRQMWAFARDKGLPFSGWLSKIHPVWNVRINCITVTIGINIVLCLINLGSTEGFNVIISLQNVGFLSTYIVSIACLIRKRISGEPLPPARWSLAKLGLTLNIVAVAFATFLFLFCLFPVSVPVTTVNMNWASAIFGGVIIVATAFYILSKHRYTSPVLFTDGKVSNGQFQGVQ